MSRARVLLASVVILVGGVVAAGCARTDRPSTEMVLAEAGRSDLPELVTALRAITRPVSAREP